MKGKIKNKENKELELLALLIWEQQEVGDKSCPRRIAKRLIDAGYRKLNQ